MKYIDLPTKSDNSKWILSFPNASLKVKIYSHLFWVFNQKKKPATLLRKTADFFYMFHRTR
ncbi:hypothetical protein DN409_24350 [Bacillus mycoides]|nr:hypothetical protein DN409_24350 [Bacillus mycoides]